MTALFLSKYGKVFGNAEAAALARRQIGSFLNYGMDYLSSLPYHGYDRQSGVKYGIIGWGRATGWLLMGMSGIICDTGDKEVLAAFREIIDAVFTHQRRDGLFSWQLEAMDGPADTSATAMWPTARTDCAGRSMAAEFTARPRNALISRSTCSSTGAIPGGRERRWRFSGCSDADY